MNTAIRKALPQFSLALLTAMLIASAVVVVFRLVLGLTVNPAAIFTIPLTIVLIGLPVSFALAYCVVGPLLQLLAKWEYLSKWSVLMFGFLLSILATISLPLYLGSSGSYAIRQIEYLSVQIGIPLMSAFAWLAYRLKL